MGDPYSSSLGSRPGLTHDPSTGNPGPLKRGEEIPNRGTCTVAEVPFCFAPEKSPWGEEKRDGAENYGGPGRALSCFFFLEFPFFSFLFIYHEERFHYVSQGSLRRLARRGGSGYCYLRDCDYLARLPISVLVYAPKSH